MDAVEEKRTKKSNACKRVTRSTTIVPKILGLRTESNAFSSFSNRVVVEVVPAAWMTPFKESNVSVMIDTTSAILTGSAASACMYSGSAPNDFNVSIFSSILSEIADLPVRINRAL